MEIYIATTQGVSIWSLEEGIQLRTIGNITKGDITAMILDEDQRRLYIADLNGNLVYNSNLIIQYLKIQQESMMLLLECS